MSCEVMPHVPDHVHDLIIIEEKLANNGENSKKRLIFEQISKITVSFRTNFKNGGQFLNKFRNDHVSCRLVMYHAM